MNQKLIVEIPLDEDWKFKAKCRGAAVNGFYFEKEEQGQIREAKTVCVGCPVRHECFDYAQMFKDKHGIWGGFTGTFRQRHRTRANRFRQQMVSDISEGLEMVVQEFVSDLRFVDVEEGSEDYKVFLFPALRPLALSV